MRCVSCFWQLIVTSDLDKMPHTLLTTNLPRAAICGHLSTLQLLSSDYLGWQKMKTISVGETKVIKVIIKIVIKITVIVETRETYLLCF